MTHLSIVEPGTLMGEAVRDSLASRGEDWDQVELFSASTDEKGAVTEVAGRAALVQPLEEDSLHGADVVLFCSSELDTQILELVPDTARAILIDPDTAVPEAIPVVAGINTVETATAARIVSPSPALILLSRLLHSLAQQGDVEMVAHVLQPASARDRAGLDELFDQTRSILSMSEQQHYEIFGTQLAFNLLPWKGSDESLATDLETILGRKLEAEIYLSQAGVFHCCSAGIFLRLGSDPGTEALRGLLEESPHIETHDEPDLLGPVAAAAAKKILLGPVTASPTKGYWIWCVMDNLACSADNALAIARY